jgi:hypothetical protein
MAKPVRKKATTQDPGDLKGWQQIAGFLGEPTSVVQRWAAQGMPVRRQGRYVTTTAEELNQWLGRESGKPVHVATDSTDLTAELKRGISFLRRNHGEKSADHPAKRERSGKQRSH